MGSRLQKWGIDKLVVLLNIAHVTACRLRGQAPRDLRPRKKAVLVVRCEAKLGDALLHLPFLRAVRQRYPDHEVHLVHHSAARDVYQACPYVDKRIEFSWSASSARSLLQRLRLCASVLGAELERCQYEVAFAPRYDDDLFSPFVVWFSGAAERLGFASRSNKVRNARNPFTDALFTRAVLDRSLCHESSRSLNLLEPVRPRAHEPLAFWWTSADEAFVSSRLQACGVAGEPPLVIVAPGAANPRRIWPLQHFAKLVRRLHADGSANVVVLGSSPEADLCARLCEDAGLAAGRNLAGQLTLAQCGALLSKAALFIGNDSGLLHLACASGTDAVEISCHPRSGNPLHPNSPLRFGPATDGSKVLQPEGPRSVTCRQGCESNEPHCILQVDEGVVSAAVDLLLAAAPGKSTAALKS
jgi:heptosyltransferase-2